MKRLVEKPQENPPSNLAIMGRYILTPEIFRVLEGQEKGAGGEIQLTDAIQALTEQQSVHSYEFKGNRFDLGEKEGFIITTIELALKDNELRLKIMSAIEDILSREKAIK